MPLFMQKMAKIAVWAIASGRDWTGTCPCVSETESERVLTWFWIWWLEIRPFFLFYKVGVAKTVALPSHSKLKTIVVGSAWLIDFILRFFQTWQNRCQHWTNEQGTANKGKRKEKSIFNSANHNGETKIQIIMNWGIKHFYTFIKPIIFPKKRPKNFLKFQLKK